MRTLSLLVLTFFLAGCFPKEIIREVVVPGATPTGAYQLNVGWYDTATLVRLEAADATAQPLGDSVTLRTIKVAPAEP